MAWDEAPLANSNVCSIVHPYDFLTRSVSLRTGPGTPGWRWGEGRPKGNQMIEKPKRATPDELAQMLALMRAIGATAPTPLALSTEPGTPWVAVGGEGIQSEAQAEGEAPKKVR